MKTLNFITGNKNKLAEVKAILGDTVELHSRAVDIPEIQGTSEDIAREKCRRAAIEVSLDSYISLCGVSSSLCLPRITARSEKQKERKILLNKLTILFLRI
jgi:hypothetical protein